VGTDPDQDNAGILQGLAEIADVLVFSQSDGRYGQLASTGFLSLDLAAPNGERMLEMLAEASREGQAVDLIVGQMWSGYIPPSALAQARDRFGVLIVNIAMDDRHAFSLRRFGREIGTRALAPYLDLAATAAPEAVDWYLKIGCPALFFPEASDPTIFRPRHGVGKSHDVCFVGMRYGIREGIVNRLRAAGISVQAHGRGWSAGRLTISEMADLFARSHIVLGVSAIGHSHRLVGLKMRDFDGPMSGTCYLTQANPDLAFVYRIGEEILVYKNEEECVEMVLALLQDQGHREEIARRGRERARRHHTWNERFATLFGVLSGTDGSSTA
jgi:hypothetical protein